jgi:branched-chain amino acid transport system substrate-binding protein
MRSDEEERSETKDEGLLTSKALSRRDFLKYAGLAGATIGLGAGLGGVIAACGGTAEETTTTAGGVTTTAAGPVTTGGATTTVSSGPTPPTQDKITIGAARPVSGVNAIFEQAHFGPAAHMWVEEINAAGGLNVAGKKLPIEYKVYDDQSDLDTSMRLLTKIMEEDKVNFVFMPCSTAFLFAAARLINDHSYIAMSAEGGATTLEPKMKDMPWFFQFLNYSNHYQMPVFADILKEVGATSCSIIYLDDLHGIEYNGQAQAYLAEAGVKILSSTPVPAGVKDVSSIIKKVQGENPDVVCSFQYPPENALTYGTMAQLNYNPKAVLGGPATSTQAFFDSFKGALDGIMFEGAWSYTQNATVKAYYDKLAAYVKGAANVDFWGGLIYRAELEFFQQAVEQAGTLDQAKIADVMRTARFKTTMADETFLTNQILDRVSYAGQIGQWQAGVPQVIDKDKRTTDKIWYPKPTWADAPKGLPASTTPSS